MLVGRVGTARGTSGDGEAGAPCLEATALLGGARIMVRTPWGLSACAWGLYWAYLAQLATALLGIPLLVVFPVPQEF
ncbi:hypothetical protein NDU88_006196 [Pleurodeles waltl]|uniref:Uncharacterized protein n=1 Tax=Pleurodeles waltl TaxID=8319 RepID=A0AAV7TDH1_PLEWA|nr:hypothetical protein NDU88_006196 [Pleurodeles waltl]